MTQGVLGLLAAVAIVGAVGAADAVRSPTFPGDPRPLLAVYLVAGVGAGVVCVVSRGRRILGTTAAGAMLLLAVAGWPQRFVPLLLAGVLAVPAALAGWPSGRPPEASGGGERRRRVFRSAVAILGGVAATLATLALVAAVAWLRGMDPPGVWSSLLVVSHLALGTIVGSVAVAARSSALVPGLVVLVGAGLLVRSLPQWVELSPEAAQGHLLAITVGVLAVAAVAALGRGSPPSSGATTSRRR